MRFGLVGTGYWARVTHAPALACTEGAELAAVWGRDPRAAADLAAEYQATAYHDVSAFLAGIDAVSFAVPPDVQAPIATQAAIQGKHLLLEKPVALTEAAADGLVEAVERAGVASVVFFTQRFQPEVRAWLAEAQTRGGWAGGVSAWLGSALRESNPFNTPWRRDRGGLWDVGPHMVSLLWASLGPVTSVTADPGPADVTHLVLHHQGGATSTTTVTLSATEAAAGFDPFELLEEVDVKIRAAELSIGNPLQSDILLQANDCGDGAILDRAQRLRRDRAGLVRGARLAQLRRPQQAADMIGAERWAGARRDDRRFA